jgi:hypothetical protein
MEEKHVVWELSFPSTELEDVAFAEEAGGSVALAMVNYAATKPFTLGLRFLRVRAYRHRAESHCTVWHIDAYDQLMEVEDSEWVAELLEATPADMREDFEMHHYVIYVDSSGCYEIVAKSWEALPETVVTDP